MAEKWIQKAIKHPGAFRAKAQRAHMGTAGYTSKVLSHPTRYTKSTYHQALLAKTLNKMRSR